MPVKLYIDFMSQPCRAVHSFLQLTKIPHELIETKIFEGKTRTPEFKLINPFSKVPAIEDDGFCLFESHAILRYLARKYQVADHWYPTDPRKMALVERYLDWHHGYLRKGCGTTVFNTLFAEKLGVKKSADVEEARKLMIYSLKMIDEVFLKENRFIAGEEISVADLSAACEISQILLMKVDLTGFKNLSEWFKKVMAIKEVQESHKVLFKIMKKYNPDPKF